MAKKLERLAVIIALAAFIIALLDFVFVYLPSTSPISGPTQLSISTYYNSGYGYVPVSTQFAIYPNTCTVYDIWSYQANVQNNSTAARLLNNTAYSSQRQAISPLSPVNTTITTGKPFCYVAGGSLSGGSPEVFYNLKSGNFTVPTGANNYTLKIDLN